MNIRKMMTVFFAAAFTMCGVTACDTTGALQNASAENGDSDKMQIVTTIFPEYDWVENVLGDRADAAEVTLLLDNGVDLHSYQPTAEDIMKISTCDMFIYVGGESDEWAEDVLENAVNKDMVVINLLDALGDGVKAEEIVEGMEAEHDHEHEEGEEADHAHEHEDGEDADHDHEHEEGEEAEHDHEGGEECEEEMDEHVWLSLRNAEVLCGTIADGLGQIDSENADVYKANAEAYKTELADLDAKYVEVVANAEVKTLLFGDRFPFRYMVDDYGLDYYAAFVGCSAETEASFETIVFLAGKTDELGLSSIMTIEGSDRRIAETIRDNTSSKDQQILTLDSLQSTTLKDAANGTSYLSVMESNLEVLKEALK